MRSLTIAVIGHVDHGKTLLVHALTGVETDTLKDEKARGLSITLGFAVLKQDDCEIHFIDTPGHTDFTRMTASGLSGASAILLVVSAREGIQKQTLEHVKLAHLFGIKHAIIAVTKTDLVEDVETHALRSEIVSLVSGFGFHDVEIVPVSARTHAGIKPLLSALKRLCKSTPHPPDQKGFFLPVDRVFSADGVGTIITGTLLGGSLRRDETVHLLPSGKSATVRGLQIGGIAAETASAGTRVAVNLRAFQVSDIRRGDVLAKPDLYAAAKRFDVRLSATSPIKHMQHIAVLFGTSQAVGRIRLYRSADGGGSGYAQLEFERPQVGFQSQRFVLRDPASAKTLAGGTILDPNAPPMTRRKAAQIEILKATETGDVIELAHKLADRDHGLVDAATLTRLSPPQFKLGDEFDRLNPTAFARIADRNALQVRMLRALSDLHAQRPCRPFIDGDEIDSALRPAPKILIESARDLLIRDAQIRTDDSKIALAHHDSLTAMSPEQRAQYDAIDRRVKAFALRPQTLFEAPSLEQQDLVDCLVWKGRLVRLYNYSLKQSILLHADAIAQAGHMLSQTFPKAQSFTTSMARKALGTNRKTVVPLLEHFDQTGLTKRRGNERSVRAVPHSLPHQNRLTIDGSEDFRLARDCEL